MMSTTTPPTTPRAMTPVVTPDDKPLVRPGPVPEGVIRPIIVSRPLSMATRLRDTSVESIFSG
jgi:hypothetical protein